MRSFLAKIVLFIAVNSVAVTGIGIHSDWDIQGKVGLLCEDGPEEEEFSSCECLKKMPMIGNLAVGPPDIFESGDVPGFADNQSIPYIYSHNNLISPSGSVSIEGLECTEGENNIITLERTIIYMLNLEFVNQNSQPENSYIKFKDTSSGLKMTYLKNITRSDPVYLASGDVKVNNEILQTIGPEDNLCGPLEEGMKKDLVQPILELIMFDGQRCPIQKGTSVEVKKNYPITLIFEEPLKCGDYDMTVVVNAPEEELASEFQLKWTVSENLHCER